MARSNTFAAAATLVGLVVTIPPYRVVAQAGAGRHMPIEAMVPGRERQCVVRS